MWIFIHRPFEIWPWLGGLRIERVLMLITLACWTVQPKAWAANRLNLGVGVLATSVLVSCVFSPYEGINSPIAQDWFKLLVFWLLLVTSIHTVNQLRTVIVAFVAIMALYELHSLSEYWNGKGEYRMGIWRMVGVDSSLGDPNSFSGSVLYGLPLLIPVATFATEKWRRRALWGLGVLALTCVALTGSRTAFAALAVFSVGIGVCSMYRWRILSAIVVLAPLVWFSLPAELKDRYLTLIDPSRGPANAQTSADSRKEFFLMALDIWGENPLLGVGPRGFAYASGTGMQSHSLYAETISELGLLGVAAVAALVLGFYKNYREARLIYIHAVRTEPVLFCYRIVLATWISVLLLLFLGLGGHNLFRFTWIWYAAFSALALKFLHSTAADQKAEAGSDSEYDPECILVGTAGSPGALSHAAH